MKKGDMGELLPHDEEGSVYELNDLRDVVQPQRPSMLKTQKPCRGLQFKA